MKSKILKKCRIITTICYGCVNSFISANVSASYQSGTIMVIFGHFGQMIKVDMSIIVMEVVVIIVYHGIIMETLLVVKDGVVAHQIEL